MRCTICGDKNLITSGVDAFLFGVPTEVYCMRCVQENPRLQFSLVPAALSSEARSTFPPR